jgi:nicotinamidase-related amidase
MMQLLILGLLFKITATRNFSVGPNPADEELQNNSIFPSSLTCKDVYRKSFHCFSSLKTHSIGDFAARHRNAKQVLSSLYTNDGIIFRMPNCTTLLLVDVQNDFHPGGSLAIPTANEDADRIAALIRSHPEKIDRIVATMDSHQKLHIAHPSFWLAGDGSGLHPVPFTIISHDDIRNGTWKPRPDLKTCTNDKNTLDREVFGDLKDVENESGSFDLTKYCIEYARRLEEKGRFQICIWPEHCLIGSTGHSLVDSVREAINEWSEQTGRSVEWVMKGQNLLTEMYSALAAEVPVSHTTAFNHKVHSSLLESDRLIVCGQAMSHCVNYTLRDIVEYKPEISTCQIYLLLDCTSSVPTFEYAANEFQHDMEKLGVLLVKSTELFQCASFKK